MASEPEHGAELPAADHRPPDPAGPGDPEAAAVRREAILAAALAVFADRGYTGSTIKAIAAAAELRSPALLYWYFPSKIDLFVAVLRRFAPVVGDLQEARGRFDLPPEVYLRRVIQEALDRFADPRTRQAYWLLLVERAQLAEHGAPLVDEPRDNLFRLLCDYLEHQITLGRLRDHDVRSAARVVVAELNLALQVRTASLGLLPELPSDDELIAGLLDVLLDGLRPR